MKVIVFLIFTTICFSLFSQSAIEGMVYAKGAPYAMGNKDGKENEKPEHEITLNSFYIDKYEVTVAAYKKFCEATKYSCN